MERELQVAYLAGVLDSDGWFTIHKNSKQSVNPAYSPDIGINQVEPHACVLAYELWGGKLGKIDYSNTENRHSQKPMVTWKPHKDGLAVLLKDIIPHLRIKKKQAEILLRLRADIVFHGRTGGRERKSLSPQTVAFRESLYQQFKGLQNAPVAETECVGSPFGEKRQSDLTGNSESSTEMIEPRNEFA